MVGDMHRLRTAALWAPPNSPIPEQTGRQAPHPHRTMSDSRQEELEQLLYAYVALYGPTTVATRHFAEHLAKEQGEWPGAAGGAERRLSAV